MLSETLKDWFFSLINIYDIISGTMFIIIINVNKFKC